MSDLNERILQIANYYKLTKPADFAKKTGFSHQVASNYLKGTRIPNGEALCIIKQTFDVSADWLLTGEGEMLKSNIDGESTSPTIIYKSDPRDAEILAANKDTIETQKETIETQRELISTLKQRINDLERGSSYSKTPAFHTVPSVDSSNPSQTGGKAKRPNK